MDGVVHFEIPASDVKEAIDFYTKIFGWETHEYEKSGYFLVNTGETDKKTMMLKKPGIINGAIMKEDNTTPYPIIVIGVKSIDETLKKVTSNKGKIVMKKTDMNMGFYAKIKDNHENIIGIWEDKSRE